MISLRLQDNLYPFDGFDHVRYVSRGIVVNRFGKIALHKVHRNDQFGEQTYYETPGGGVDEDETYQEAFLRECKEELGAEVTILGTIGEVEDAYNLIKRKNINRFFLAKLERLGRKRFSSSGDNLIEETVWVGLSEAIELYKKQEDSGVAGLVKQRELPVLLEVKRLRDDHRISWPHQPYHLGTKPIHTKRLTLRKFEVRDAEMMFDNWAGDPEVAEYLEWPAHASSNVTRSVLEVWVNKYRDPTFYQWGIVINETNTLIGSISVIHSEYNAVEIGFALSKQYWHKGYAKEALRALLHFFFEEVGIRRVFAKHDVANIRAEGVLKACKMRLKETIPHGGFDQHGVCDVNVYEMKLEEHLSRKSTIW